MALTYIILLIKKNSAHTPKLNRRTREGESGSEGAVSPLSWGPAVLDRWVHADIAMRAV